MATIDIYYNYIFTYNYLILKEIFICIAIKTISARYDAGPGMVRTDWFHLKGTSNGLLCKRTFILGLALFFGGNSSNSATWFISQKYNKLNDVIILYKVQISQSYSAQFENQRAVILYKRDQVIPLLCILFTCIMFHKNSHSSAMISVSVHHWWMRVMKYIWEWLLPHNLSTSWAHIRDHQIFHINANK